MSPPRLVLVHGTRFSHTQWTGYAERLAGIDVVTPDLPGHGAAMGDPFTTDAAVETIDTAVEDGDPAAPVVLAGHSLGGYMAAAYAERHPTRLAGLVLIGASAVPQGVGAALYRGVARAVDRVGHDRAGRAVNWLLVRITGEETLEAVLAGGASYAATADAWAAVMADCRPEALAAVRCPVLVVRGRWDQLGVDARRYAAQCHDARVVTVPGATHLLPITHPEATAALLRAFVQQVTDSDRGRAT